jgi:PP-loop superfamily ATP-utilizing enzyme
LKNYISTHKDKIYFEKFIKNINNKILQRKKVERFDHSKFIDLRFSLKSKIYPSTLSHIKADAVSFLSGGVDSLLAAFLFANKYPQKKIVLLTFINIPPYTGETSWMSSAILMDKCKNIINHIIIKVPYKFCSEFIFKDIEKIYQTTGMYFTCDSCELLRVTYAVFLLKKYWGGDTIIMGKRRVDKPKNSPGEKITHKFLNLYSIRRELPVFSFTKEENFSKAMQHGLLYASYLQFKSQAACTVNLIKSRNIAKLVKSKRIEKKYYLYYLKRKIRECIFLLEKNGVKIECRRGNFRRNFYPSEVTHSIAKNQFLK